MVPRDGVPGLLLIFFTLCGGDSTVEGLVLEFFCGGGTNAGLPRESDCSVFFSALDLFTELPAEVGAFSADAPLEVCALLAVVEAPVEVYAFSFDPPTEVGVIWAELPLEVRVFLAELLVEVGVLLTESPVEVRDFLAKSPVEVRVLVEV